MSKLTKNQKLAAEKIEAGKAYSLKEAAELVKEITFTKFDASLDIDVRLGVDPRKANQMVRGVVSLPHGTGKVTRVLCLCTPDAEAAAKEAGADYVGLDEYIEKIKGGWTDIDVIITMVVCLVLVDLCQTQRVVLLLWMWLRLYAKLSQVRLTLRLTRAVSFILQSVRHLSQLSRFARMQRLSWILSRSLSHLLQRVLMLRVFSFQLQ